MPPTHTPGALSPHFHPHPHPHSHPHFHLYSKHYSHSLLFFCNYKTQNRLKKINLIYLFMRRWCIFGSSVHFLFEAEWKTRIWQRRKLAVGSTGYFESSIELYVFVQTFTALHVHTLTIYHLKLNEKIRAFGSAVSSLLNPLATSKAPLNWMYLSRGAHVDTPYVVYSPLFFLYFINL